jgi:hypothetical protein
MKACLLRGEKKSLQQCDLKAIVTHPQKNAATALPVLWDQEERQALMELALQAPQALKIPFQHKLALKALLAKRALLAPQAL